MTFAHLEEVLAESRPLAELFVAAQHRIYLVGGIVRDLWLDRPVGDDLDLDLTTDALPPRIKELIGGSVDAVWLQGERFGTIGAKLNNRSYEITTHRSEIYRSDSRKPTVTFSDAIEEDLSRRDFTVNAMALQLPDATLIDPHGGAEDLAAGTLRTPLDPTVSFGDDPLRMLRAARFAAGYNLTPDAALVQAMADMAQRLDIISAERIRDEFDKMLAVADPGAGLSLLASTGLLERFLPTVAGLPEDRRVDLFARVAAMAPSTSERFAALLTAAEVDPAPVMRQLRHSSERVRWTKAVCLGARAVLDNEVVTAPALRRWWAAAHPATEPALMVAHALGGTNQVAAVRALVAQYGEDLNDLSVPLTGEDIMAILHLEPGPQVGQAMRHLRAARMDRGPLSREQAEALLHAWDAAVRPEDTA